MTEQERPGIKPKEELWDHCLRLAELHKLTPLVVLNRLLWVGDKVADIEEKGGNVFAELDGKKIEVRTFSEKEN